MDKLIVRRHSRDHEASLRCEYMVFVEAGYIAANKETRVLAYDDYTCSEFLSAYDGDVLVGTTRLIRDDDGQSRLPCLPTAANFPLYPEAEELLCRVGPKKIIEMATLAIIRSRRDTRVRAALVRAAIARAWQKKRWYSLLSLDRRLYRLLRMERHPLVQIGEARFFMGSVTVPCLYDATALGNPRVKGPRAAFSYWLARAMASVGRRRWDD